MPWPAPETRGAPTKGECKLHCAPIMTKLGVYSAAHLQPITYLSAEAFLADTERPKFDCLVLDIQLKGMSGLELRQRLFGVMDATPVIFITAHKHCSRHASTPQIQEKEHDIETIRTQNNL